MKNTQGFGLIGLLLVIAIIALLAFGGFSVLQKDSPGESENLHKAEESPVERAANIKTQLETNFGTTSEFLEIQNNL